MNKSYLVALGIAIIAVVWVGSSYIWPSQTPQDGDHKNARAMDAVDQAMAVQVETVSPQSYQQTIKLNGRTRGSKDITIRAEAEGQVIAIVAVEGESVANGAPILKVDVQEKKERVREARELVKQRQIEFDAAKKLLKQGFGSDVRVAQTQSAYESSRAAMTQAELDLEKTTVTAPFEGILGVRHVDIGDYLRIGDAVSEMVDLSPLKVTIFVNEQDVRKVKKGNAATIIFSGEDKRQGVVTFVSPIANKETRTFQVDIEIANDQDMLPAGLTVDVEVAVEEKMAHSIPPSVLSLNKVGQVGLKIVDDANIVRFIPVDMAQAKSDDIWVLGLRGDVRVITVGQDFVDAGQEVNAVEKEGE